MSDMMQRAPAGGQAPPSPLAKPNAITSNLSAINPADAGLMAQSGTINKNMTVKDWIENVLRIPITAPVTELIGALKSQVQNRNMAGKAKSMGQSAPQSAPMQRPQGMAPQGAPPRPAPSAPQGGGGVSGLMNAMRG